jgi:hypothetical protein
MIVVVAGAGIAYARIHHNRNGTIGSTTGPTSNFNSGSDNSGSDNSGSDNSGSDSNQSQSTTGIVVVPSGAASINTFLEPRLYSAKRYALQNDQSVEIKCTAQGDLVTENGLSSSLWYYTNYGFIAAVELYSTTDPATIPGCP